MAISKILHMKDSGNSFHARHLKRALDYVMNPEKTQGGRLVGAINCQADMAFEQMMDTKKQFGKTDKRQGYHIILSFKEDEVEPDRAFEITQKFVAEYLGDAYEAVFVVHDNTDHVHSHIVFNSVSFVDGKKYRYEKGDWAKYIQPITNKLCQEYGLSIIDVEDGSKEKQHENYKDWSEYREGSFVWADMIKRDLDACILQANDFSGFLELLSEKGYEVKQGKYLAVRPQGMTRFRRCKTLGENYSQEAIVERIAKEDLSFYQSQNVDVDNRFTVYGIRDLGTELSPITMLVMMESIQNRIVENGKRGKATWLYIDEFHVLLNSEYSAKYLQQLWKKVRKQGGLCTGITQNVVDLLQNYTATTMLANSEFVALLKQANTDSSKMAEVIGVSEAQLRFVTNTASGMGLIKCGSVVIPFDNQISKDTDLYRLYNTNIHEKIAEQKKKEAMLQ